MNKLAKLSAFVVAGSALATPVAAQDTAQDVEKRLRELEQKVKVLDRQRKIDEQIPAATEYDVISLQQSLENFRWEWGRARDLHTALTRRSLQIGGVVQARAGWSEEEVTNDSLYERDSSFDIGAALLTFRGNLYRDYEEGRNLDYRLSFGASPQANAPSLDVLDANITYNLWPTLDKETGRLAVTAGQRLLPFGLEVSASEELKPVIRNAQFASEMGLSSRQIGVFVTGDLDPFVDHGFNYRAPRIAFDFGLVNGAGANNSDDNGKKDLVGRVQWIVPVEDYNSLLREIKVGVSGYYGHRNLDPGSGQEPIGTGKKNRFGLDVSYNHNPIGLTVEYVRGSDEQLSEGVETDRDSESTVATLFWNEGEQFVGSYRGQARYDDWWPNTYQPFFRWDRFDPDTDESGDHRTVYTLGFNLFFAQTTKFQINLNRIEDKSTNSENHELLTQLQFGF